MIGASATRRSVAGFGVFTLLMVALLVGLGVGQLQRRPREARADRGLDPSG